MADSNCKNSRYISVFVIKKLILLYIHTPHIVFPGGTKKGTFCEVNNAFGNIAPYTGIGSAEDK